MSPAHNEPHTLPLLESHSLTVTITHVFDRFAFMVRVSAMGHLQALSLQYHSPYKLLHRTRWTRDRLSRY